MCGITGLVTCKDDQALLRLQRMTSAIPHRGPDDHGVISWDGVYLGHRRLSIIDPSPASGQPMANEDASIWITYNGEVNSTDCERKRLRSHGHRFRSLTDTEVIVHLYEEEGSALFRHINGMFPFAIHDRKRNKLLLARDRLGIKPLFYAFIDGELFFASELKAIFAGLGRKPSLRSDVLGQYILQGYASAPDTVYKEIWALLPGHYLSIDLSELKAGRLPQALEYWDAAFTGDDARSADEIESELQSLLSDAVHIRMVADVPLGSFPSGGIDSSSVVALMAKASRDPVRTFTVDWPGTDRSERPKAQMVADKYGTLHTVIDCTNASAEDFWPRLHHFDAPFNCPSLLNAWLVSRAARQHVHVALSGDGGD